MRVFIDTSGYFSLLDRDDQNHNVACQIFQNLLTNDDVLITHNYVLVETSALVQNRLGMAANKNFHDHFVPLTEISWIDHEFHQVGLAAYLTANRRQLSLVDCVSFELCRRLGIDNVFAFDKHFQEQGFTLCNLID